MLWKQAVSWIGGEVRPLKDLVVIFKLRDWEFSIDVFETYTGILPARPPRFWSGRGSENGILRWPQAGSYEPRADVSVKFRT